MFYFNKYFLCFVCFFSKTPSVIFSLPRSSVQNSPEILCGKTNMNGMLWSNVSSGLKDN